MLLQLSQFFPLYSPSLPSTQHPPLAQATTTSLFVPMGHASESFAPFPALYFTSPWLLCNYLFVLLNPSPLHPFPHIPSHLATTNTLSVSMVLSLFFLFA